MENVTAVAGEYASTIGNVEQSDDTNNSFEIIRSTMLICLCFMSCVGNFLVCFTLYRRQYLLTPSNKLVFSLTVSNFMFSVLILPFMIMSSIQQLWLAGKAWCSVTGFVTLTTLGASMFTLAIISFDRYYAVIYPLKYPSFVTSCRILCIIVCVWLIAALISLPPLFGFWSIYQFSAAQMGCLPLWRLNKSFSVFWIVVCLILPLCVMLVSYFFVFRVAWTKTQRVCRVNPVPRSKVPGCYSEDHSENSSKVNGELKTVDLCVATEEKTNNCSDSEHLSHQLHDSGVGTSTVDNTDVAPYCSIILPHQVDDCISFDVKLQNERVVSKSRNNNANSGCDSNSRLPSSPNISYSQSSHHLCSNNVEYLAIPNVSARMTSVSSSQKNSWMQTKLTLGDASTSFRASRQNSFHSALSCHSNDVSSFSPGSRNLSHSSINSKISRRSIASTRSKLPSFSFALYYRNQKKALCTICCVVGALLLCCLPFIVTSLYDAIHAPIGNTLSFNPAVDDWLLSTATMLLLLTCVYHPLIYGFWNYTVRQEMMSILCGNSRAPSTRRTRILSLTSHLKDLSLSSRLTAAIMLEGAAMATIVQPMKLDEKSLKTQPNHVLAAVTSSRRTGLKKHRRKMADDAIASTTESTATAKGETVENPTTTPLDEKEANVKEGRNVACGKGHEVQTLSEGNCTSSKYRGREELVTSTLRIESSQLLGSDLLVPTLLYTNPARQYAVGHADNFSTPTPTEAEQLTSSFGHESSGLRKATLLQPGNEPESTEPASGNLEPLGMNFRCQNDKVCGDSIAKLTGGRLRSANLLHLHAKEPVKVRKWNKEQTIDFFAQTFTYGLFEELNEN